MATAIVSIASLNAGFQVLSIVLLYTAVAAFVPLALLDLWLIRHPLTLFRRAAQPGQGFHALGFVADGCVLGVRIAQTGSAALTIATVLFACGFVLWALILAAVAIEHGRGGRIKPRGEWLLTVVATEGLAILATHIAGLGDLPALRPVASVLWIAGGVAYLLVGGLLARRASQPDFGVGNVTPDWWIVMGAPAIWCVAAVTVTGAQPGTIGAALAVGAWALASVMLIAIAAVDACRTRRLGVRFTPERWTMVFPLGMYSVASWMLGQSLNAGWLSDLGRLWLAVAVSMWAAVAFGEMRHLLAGPYSAGRRGGASTFSSASGPRAASTRSRG
jgi:tellurite resistance protein TehA-like permease